MGIWSSLKGFVTQVGKDLAPFWRGGLVDLQNAVVHSFPESQRQAEVLGMPGNPTSQQVTQEQDFDKALDQSAEKAGKERHKDRGMDMG